MYGVLPLVTLYSLLPRTPTHSSSLGVSQGCQLLGLLDRQGLGTLLELGLGLESHDSSSPLADQVGVVVVLLHGQVLHDFELGLVFGRDTLNGNARGGAGVVWDLACFEESETLPTDK